MDKEKILMEKLIRKKLENELNYSKFSAEQTAGDLVKIGYSDIKEALVEWVSGKAEICVFEGEYSTNMLRKNYDMTYPAALIFIGWLREDPVTAESTLRARM